MEQTTEDVVRNIVAEQLNARPDEITSSTNLEEDLQCDSLDRVEIVMALEELYHIEIPDEDCVDEKMATLGQLVVYVESRIK